MISRAVDAALAANYRGGENWIQAHRTIIEDDLRIILPIVLDDLAHRIVERITMTRESTWRIPFNAGVEASADVVRSFVAERKEDER